MKPSPEQLIAIERFLERRTYGCFDPQGSGKTAVAINAIQRNVRYPALITVPAHLASQWRDEIIRWGFPPEEVSLFTAAVKPVEKLAALTGETAISIVSYNTWNTYSEQLLAPFWTSYTFDESHRLRKARGATWKEIYRLRTKTRSKHLHTPVWCLSGTPLVRDAGDIFPFLSLCEPERYRYNARQKFVKEVCHTFQGDYSLKVGAVRDPKSFHALLGRYSIRRRWQDIPSLASLERRDIPMPVHLEDRVVNRQRKIKVNWRDPETGDPILSSGQMVRVLRRLSVPAKVAAVNELVQDSTGRWLLLAWYRETTQLMAEQVKRHRPVAYVDGSTSLREREAAYQLYRNNSSGVIVGTVGALKEGLNLQAGSQIAFVEQDYLPSPNEQCVGRLLRRGQRQPVLIYWLYGERSFDVKVRRQSRKRKVNIDKALEEYLENEEWSR